MWSFCNYICSQLEPSLLNAVTLVFLSPIQLKHPTCYFPSRLVTFSRCCHTTLRRISHVDSPPCRKTQKLAGNKNQTLQMSNNYSHLTSYFSNNFTFNPEAFECLEWSHHQNMPFKMNFILLTFTGTSLTLILHLLHMSILYRCNITKKEQNKKTTFKSPWCVLNGAPIGDELQQCSKKKNSLTQEGFLSGPPAQWRRLQRPTALVGHNLPDKILPGCAWGQSHNADADVKFADFCKTSKRLNFNQ